MRSFAQLRPDAEFVQAVLAQLPWYHELTLLEQQRRGVIGLMYWELEDVEKPFVAQLVGLGWTHIPGNLDDPTATGRTSFAEVIQESVLREQLYAFNLGPDGQPWLDDGRLNEAVTAITRLGTRKLMEANEQATSILIRGLTVEGLPGWDGGRGQTIRYVDWDTPANNRFSVVNQYRVDCPPGFNITASRST